MQVYQYFEDIHVKNFFLQPIKTNSYFLFYSK